MPIFLLEFQQKHGRDPQPEEITLPQRVIIQQCIDSCYQFGSKSDIEKLTSLLPDEFIDEKDRKTVIEIPFEDLISKDTVSYLKKMRDSHQGILKEDDVSYLHSMTLAENLIKNSFKDPEGFFEKISKTKNQRIDVMIEDWCIFSVLVDHEGKFLIRPGFNPRFLPI